MTPGNANPNRYAGRSTLSAVVLALIAAGASAPTIYQQFLAEKEGTRLVAYLDSAGIPTICGGLIRIDGMPVKLGMRLTKEQCEHYDSGEQTRGLAAMERLVKPEIWAGMSEASRAGTASFCVHNIGEGKCKTSTFLRELNAGHRNAACAQITLWIRDGGKDCRDPRANCGGQVVRRPQEDELCLMP